MVIRLKSDVFLTLGQRAVSGFKALGMCLLVMAAMTACSQEKNTMNSSNLSSLSPIVLKNTPANAESIVLGMGCFWGAENRTL